MGLKFAHLAVCTKNVNDGLEGKPLRNVLPGAEHLSKLGSGELVDGEALLLCIVSGDIPLFYSVNQIKGWDSFHTELWCMLLCEILSIVRSVEVVSSKGALGSSHVSSNDEMSAPVVLTDDHVLNCLTWSSHVHRIWKVFPENVRVLSLLLENFVSLVSNRSWDIISLSWTTGRMNKYNAAFLNVFSIKGASEELVVGTVDRIAALESDNILSSWKFCANLCRSLAWEVPHRKGNSLKRSSKVVLPTLSRNHQTTWMLKSCDAIKILALLHFIRLVFALNLHNSNVLAFTGKSQFHSRFNTLVIGVEDNRKTKDVTGS
mmetsp:Transcript_17065/g.23895  ORF Transcript_17065/g.23895 Transcript_17065/m.23895 type:complete len:318 (-) Transcript_17065:487-1440(-)